MSNNAKPAFHYHIPILQNRPDHKPEGDLKASLTCNITTNRGTQQCHTGHERQDHFNDANL